MRIPRPVNGGNPSVKGCYGYRSAAHQQKFNHKGTVVWAKIGVARSCCDCRGLSDRLSVCPIRTSPMADINSVFPSGGNGGG